VTRGLAVLALGAACVACQIPPSPVHVPDGTVYEGTHNPVQYRAALIRDLKVNATPKQAYGEACKTGFYLPTYQVSPFLGSSWLANAVTPFNVGVVWGNAGVIRAIAEAKESSGAKLLYNVRLDQHSTAILGVWHRDCVEVHADVLAD
jgi:hypothetical protein